VKVGGKSDAYMVVIFVVQAGVIAIANYFCCSGWSDCLQPFIFVVQAGVIPYSHLHILVVQAGVIAYSHLS
jgi:hypothetical protein